MKVFVHAIAISHRTVTKAKRRVVRHPPRQPVRKRRKVAVCATAQNDNAAALEKDARSLVPDATVGAR
eukprot:CAMPEP_0178999070 /NCGR_PEP_ID=MMETSP0795-20121207/9851_1 /TAXON_ID=88552 /ORGANISM="Amoebophrya sp., Strain Ameob2" /LENGTH=67 /DNA_ID=CAMNT_0020691793 /DNA_START=385 /DNA_END=588 /DNA_ORIENTATION=-